MPVFIGLDCEMTGTNIDLHELCQVGAATTDGDVFCSDIRCRLDRVNSDSMAVHKIDPSWLKEGAPELHLVDRRLAYFLQQHTGRAASLVPVGWGVSYFDMPWVRKHLPSAAGYLSRRSVELGSVCYSIGATYGMSPDTLKRKSKRYAEARNDDAHTWHNAGYDAVAALLCWEYLMKVMKAGEYVEWN